MAVALGVMASVTAVASAGEGKRTLRLHATETEFSFLDLGDPGMSLGDEFVFTEVLSRRGREVGSTGVTCTITSVGSYDAARAQCVGTLRLKRGQITAQGLLDFSESSAPEPFFVAITGGTGAYRNATGQIRIRDLSETESVYSVRLGKAGHRTR